MRLVQNELISANVMQELIIKYSYTVRLNKCLVHCKPKFCFQNIRYIVYKLSKRARNRFFIIHATKVLHFLSHFRGERTSFGPCSNLFKTIVPRGLFPPSGGKEVSRDFFLTARLVAPTQRNINGNIFNGS